MKLPKITALTFSLLFLIIPTITAGPIPDTGQTTCYDEVGYAIACPSPGEPYYGQDANYNIKPPSYTKLDANGTALPDSAPSWAMVKDNVTGLIWEVKRNMDGVKNYDDPYDADNTYTWYDSNPETNGGNAGTPGYGTDTEDFVNALNSTNYGGYSDWRLPTRKELRSIVDFARYQPAINTAYFPDTDGYANYWSSNPSGYDTQSTWIMHFQYGQSLVGSKNIYFYIRAVRGGFSGCDCCPQGYGGYERRYPF